MARKVLHKPAKSRAGRLAETQESLRKAELLLEASRKIAAKDRLDDALEALVEIISKELNVERSTLFLNDPATGELYSRIAQGSMSREIRMLNDVGIAGAVFKSGVGELIADPYGDERFNPQVDEKSGFTTKSMACVPVKTASGEVIGVTQALNRKKGKFVQKDLDLLEAISAQAALTLQSKQFVEKMEKTRAQEIEFMNVVSDVTSELELGSLLTKVMEEATRMLSADRSTLFLNDEKTEQLFSRVTMGDVLGEIRLPNHAGIAGAVFISGKTINIPYAYADLRFNPSFDKQTGYFTRSILCVPVVNKDGMTIGVTQVLNKKGGAFSYEDETRLKAFTAQVSIALENAKLFEDVQKMKNYNESMLESMSNGVITMNEEGNIVTCNGAGLRIMNAEPDDVIHKNVDTFFAGENSWLTERVKKVEERGVADVLMDCELHFGDDTISANINVLPLVGEKDEKLGSMVMIEDISTEKRIKSTMSRYIDPGIADQLLTGNEAENFLGGKSSEITVLFSDVRSFTTLTEELGAQGTVEMLNEYFTIMVECITREGGMLDKFIGDAIMAGFGIPISHDDDEDRAVRAAIAMVEELWEWNTAREADGKLAIDHGVGLNTGLVVSGNIGSPKRMDYTMIGDGVNLAARLESACKQYSAHVLISEFTRAKLKGTYRLRDIDMVVVKGKTEPVKIFEVLDYHTPETFPNLMDSTGYFNEAVLKYRAGEWDKSKKKFTEALAANPNDNLAKIYIERCQQLKANPPKSWNGIWVMTSK